MTQLIRKVENYSINHYPANGFYLGFLYSGKETYYGKMTDDCKRGVKVLHSGDKVTRVEFADFAKSKDRGAVWEKGPDGKQTVYLGLLSISDITRPHGLGVQICPDGSWKYGSWTNGVANGKFVCYDNGEKEFYFALLENGKQTAKKAIEIKGGLNIPQTDISLKFPPKVVPDNFHHTSGATSKGELWEKNLATSGANNYAYGTVNWGAEGYAGLFKEGIRCGLGAYNFKTGTTEFCERENNKGVGTTLTYREDKRSIWKRGEKREGAFLIEPDCGFQWYAAIDGNYDKSDFVGVAPDITFIHYCYSNGKFVDKEEVVFPSDMVVTQKIVANSAPSATSTKTTVDTPTPKPTGTNLTAEEELDQLIGLESVKKQLRRIRAFIIKNRDRKISMHMVFSGNPGTGKTVVARLLGQILHNEGVLPTSKFIEADREKLVAQYIGQTAVKTKEAIDSAMGGVLFIDEAYSLNAHTQRDFGYEAIQVLLKEMEDRRGNFCCIMAGYTKEMQQLFEMNPGFKSRVQFFIDFPDYSDEELAQIADLMLSKDGYSMDAEARKLAVKVVATKRAKANFANAREMRSLLEQCEMIQSERTVKNISDKTIKKVDVQTYIEENNIKL